MTCLSSLNSCSIVKFELRLELGDQELSNHVLNAFVRRRKNWLWYMANQTDGSQARKTEQIPETTQEKKPHRG